MPLPILAAAIPVAMIGGRAAITAAPRVIGRVGPLAGRLLPSSGRAGASGGSRAGRVARAAAVPASVAASVVIPGVVPAARTGLRATGGALRTSRRVAPFAAAGAVGLAAGRASTGASPIPGLPDFLPNLSGGQTALVLGGLAVAGFVAFQAVKK